MNRLKIIRTSLDDERLLKLCKIGKGEKTCPFIALHTSVNQKGILECNNFTREGVETGRIFRQKHGILKRPGCNYVLEKFLEDKKLLIDVEVRKKVEYINRPNDEEKFLVDFVFDPENNNFSVLAITERDAQPFVVLSANPEKVCLKETETHIIIYNIIGHEYLGISISKK